MNNVLMLTNILIKNSVFGFSGRKRKGKSTSSKGSVIAFCSLMAVSAILVGAPIIFSLSEILGQYDVSELIISYMIPIGAFTTIIFGIFSVMSIFYFSKDSENLLPLPIKSSELLISKFFASLISEYLMLFIFVYPVLIGVGLGTNANIVYYLYLLIIGVLLPIVPTVLVSLIIMLANKIFNFSKKKDIFMYAMTFLIIAFSFTYTFLIERVSGSSFSDITGEDYYRIIATSKYLFPFLNSASYALNNYNSFIGFASIMTFIGINILSMIVLYLVGDHIYIKGLTREAGSRKAKSKQLSEVYKDKNKSIIATLINKDWLCVKRSPVFMLNIVIVSFILPIVFIVSFLFGLNGSNGGAITSLFGDYDYRNGGFLIIIIGVLSLFNSMSPASSCAISREGNGAYYMKTIPISLKKQIDAKVYFSMCLDLVTTLIVEGIIFWLFKLPVVYILLINVPLILLLLISNYLLLILDLKHPKLDWKDENEAVKQNITIFFATIGSIVFAILFISIGVVLTAYSINIYLIFSLISVLLLTCYLVLMYYIKKNQSALFDKVG